jgi:hypothetical protein
MAFWSWLTSTFHSKPPTVAQLAYQRIKGEKPKNNAKANPTPPHFHRVRPYLRAFDFNIHEPRPTWQVPFYFLVAPFFKNTDPPPPPPTPVYLDPDDPDTPDPLEGHRCTTPRPFGQTCKNPGHHDQIQHRSKIQGLYTTTRYPPDRPATPVLEVIARNKRLGEKERKRRRDEYEDELRRPRKVPKLYQDHFKIPRIDYNNKNALKGTLSWITPRNSPPCDRSRTPPAPRRRRGSAERHFRELQNFLNRIHRPEVSRLYQERLEKAARSRYTNPILYTALKKRPYTYKLSENSTFANTMPGSTTTTPPPTTNNANSTTTPIKIRTNTNRVTKRIPNHLKQQISSHLQATDTAARLHSSLQLSLQRKNWSQNVRILARELIRSGHCSTYEEIMAVVVRASTDSVRKEMGVEKAREGKKKIEGDISDDEFDSDGERVEDGVGVGRVRRKKVEGILRSLREEGVVVDVGVPKVVVEEGVGIVKEGLSGAVRFED